MMGIGVSGIGPHEKNEAFRGTPLAGGTLMGILSAFPRDGPSEQLRRSHKYLQLA